MAARLLTRFSRFSRDVGGAIAPIFALAVIPLVVAMGAVVDYTNAYDKRTVIQDSMDSAALAAGKKIGTLTQAQLGVDVNAYYYANVGTRLSSPPDLQVALQTSTITLTTDLIVPTYFLGIIGLQHLDFHITSQATLALGTLEVAMVLDNSGSMQTNNNIATLRTAANNLATTLWALGATSTKPNPIQIGLVPFAASVNVGSSYQTDATATWLDKTGVGTYNADGIDGAATTANPFTLFAGMSGVTWGGCLEMRPIPNDATDAAAVVATPSSMFVPLFAPDEPDNWTCDTGTCEYIGTSTTRRFLGAPTGTQDYNNYLPDVPQKTATVVASSDLFTSASHGMTAGTQIVFQTTGTMPGGLTAGAVGAVTSYYVISTGLTANAFKVSTTSGGSAVNVTTAGSGTLSYTKVKDWTCDSGTAACGGTGNGVSEGTAMSSIAKYGTATSKVTPVSMGVGYPSLLGPGGPNFMCTSAKLQPLTTTQATVTTAVNNMIALGATNIEEGLMWGWRTLSPTAPFTEGRAYTVTDNQKIIVLMTDGENTYFPTTNSTLLKSWYAAWGYVGKNHLGTTSTTTSVVQGKMDDRTAAACVNVKGAGIKVYVVAFTGSDGISDSTQAMLKTCASDPSMYYLASNQSALLSAFSAIGDQITLLRISQ